MKIIIVESVAHVRQDLCARLQHQGHDVAEFATGGEALLYGQSYTADLLIAGHQLADMSGSEMASHIRRWSANSAMPVLILRDRSSVFATSAIRYLSTAGISDS